MKLLLEDLFKTSSDPAYIQTQLQALKSIKGVRALFLIAAPLLRNELKGSVTNENHSKM